MKPMTDTRSEQMIIKILGEARATGKFISVDFVKADGSLRTLVCKVGPDALNRLDRDIITVFDVQNGGYRSFNINSVLYVTHDNQLTAAF